MKKKYLIKYSFEFVVIVLGISVSFWLNELSIDNQNEDEAQAHNPSKTEPYNQKADNEA